MTRAELVDAIARAIAEKEGFYVTEEDARRRGIRWPTRAQRNANPGNIRVWRDERGRWYPTDGGIGSDGRPRGYVDFVAWASEQFPGASHDELSQRALDEGWRVLRVLVGQYLDGKYTQGKPPTLEEMFRVYAPSADGNHPANYARFVAGKIGIRPDQPLSEVIT